ncbi:hypothetical protein BZG36_05151 [Bifiguratus adelaidae]|uniref:Major facilitator superfamily (MFS) profile domain-containing protein n=1 Tax=Bifiguratus adelaidae TaxID=1938954 RepID=A0A261XU23_9FUNG|nr:hypothetical protein BZG36_05151 [Bifiguratus adelaidae]
MSNDNTVGEVVVLKEHDPSQIDQSGLNIEMVFEPKISDDELPDGGYGCAVGCPSVGISEWLRQFNDIIPAVLAGPLISKFEVRNVLIIGTVMLVLGLQLTSLVHTLWPLFFKVSLLGGVGSSMVFIQGLALGIAASGGGLCGMAFAEIVSKLIGTVGLPWAIRIEGFMFLALLLVSIALVKPFVGGYHDPGGSVWDASLFKNIHYDFLLLSAFIYAFSYLIFVFYLPAYAQAKWLGTSTS